MPRKTNPRSERALLLEVRRFMGSAVGQLTALTRESRTLRHQLQQTESYRRACGQETGEREWAFDQAGVLGVMLEDDLSRAIVYLHEAARRAGLATRRRTARP